jgi:hypothetical protein
LLKQNNTLKNMKKLVLISSLVAMLAGMSAFGQGYFTFSASTRYVWDDTIAANRTDISNSVAFFLATSGTPTVDNIMSAVPTNNTTSYSYATAWSDILGDSYTLATNFANGLVATTNVNANGSFTYSYLGTGSFGVTNTTGPTTYDIYMVAWNNEGDTLLTPQAAALAGAAVGWSSVFTYGATVAPPIGNPGAMVPTQFGVGYVTAAPEPGTMALAGLGGISMLLFRRRNKA